MDDAAVLHEPAGRSLAASRRHPDAERRARISRRGAGEADLLRRHPQVLPRARRGQPPGQSGDDRQVRRRSRARCHLDRQRREHEIAREEPRQPGEDRGPSWAHAGADQTADRNDEAALPPDGGAPQRRNGSVGDADGARLPSGHRDLSTDQTDSRQRHRIDHAGRGYRRPRPQRRLVLQDAGESQGAEGAGCSGCGRGAEGAGVPKVRGCAGCGGCEGAAGASRLLQSTPL